MRSKMLGKVLLIVSILIFYIVMAAALLTAVATGVIQRDLPQEVHIYSDDSTLDLPIARAESIPSRLSYAQTYMNKYLVRTNGHVELYVAAAASTSSDAKDATANNDRTQESVSKNNTQNTSKNGTKDMQDAAHPTALTDRGTNSEAASYYLLWTVQANDKTAFDRELAFIDKYMQHPTFGYMMWRLTPNATVQGDGENIATDADLRAIKALLLAEKQWGDEKYTKMIDELASGLEKVGVTKDGYLAPYGGVSGETSVWVADEVWLSYADFTVFRELSTRRGMPWTKMYTLMKDAVLGAQIQNGLYNSMLTQSRHYGNGIDAGGYSINSLWIMVRNAESGDLQLMESANKSLQFYRNKMVIDSELYAQYDSTGNPLSPTDTPWVYALVARAAIALNDREFSDLMIEKLLEHQNLDSQSWLYGSFPEGYAQDTRVGQFTMQESILSLQDYIART